MVRGSRLTDGVDRGGLREVRAPKPRLSWFAPTTGWFPRRRRRSPFFGVGFARAAAAGERLLFLICLRTRARSLSLFLPCEGVQFRSPLLDGDRGSLKKCWRSDVVF